MSNQLLELPASIGISNLQENATNEYAPSGQFLTIAAKETQSFLTDEDDGAGPLDTVMQAKVAGATDGIRETHIPKERVFSGRSIMLGNVFDNERTIVTHQWEGIVLSITGNIVCAEISDLLNDNSPNELVEFSLSDIELADKMIAEEGAAFYFTIYESVSLNGVMKSARSRIRFRRSPVWSNQQIQSLENEVQKLSRME